MLSAKENLLKTIHGGKPDRYVNQYEAFCILPGPMMLSGGKPLVKGGADVVNAWGVTQSYPAHTPGPFPVHTKDKIVVKDIERWRDFVHAPSLDFPQEAWEKLQARYDAVDTEKAFKTAMVAPGLFEQTHHLCSITQALMYYITNPDEMHELIRFLADWELELAYLICEKLKPEAIFHHDDWGSEVSSFMSPEMFADFFVEPYKEIYGYYHDHGVQLIVHHSDSYAANLVPSMIEMGIDIWQGCMRSNNVPHLSEKYGGKISFMGNIDNKDVDFDSWQAEDCRRAARRAIESCPNRYYIPCITQGLPGSVYPGAYAQLTAAIDEYNAETFGFSVQDLRNARFILPR